MPMPELDSFAQSLYDSIAPLTHDDAVHDYPLAKYCAALGKMFQVTEDYGRNDGGWDKMMNVTLTPVEVLPWLAQFVGVRLEEGLTEVAQRSRVQETAGWKRGSVPALRGAAASYITDPKTFILRERFNPAAPGVDSPGHLQVITYTSQTPDSAKVLAALTAQKAAGLILHYSVYDGQDYQTLLTNHPTYQNVYTSYATYQGIVTDQPGS